MELSGHDAYVAAAYAIALLVVAGLVGWVLLDMRSQRRALRELDERGVRRRSDRRRAP